MQHFHFGAGHFGLGFVLFLAGSARLESTIINRPNLSLTPQKDDDISPKRRLELLAANSDYFIRHSHRTAGSVKRIHYKRFIEYPKGSVEHYQLLSDLTCVDTVLVTCSLGETTGYDLIASLVVEAALARKENGNTLPIYVIACENEIRTEELEKRIRLILGNSTPAHNIRSLNIVPVEAVVDRVCSKFSEADATAADAQNSKLVVHAEDYARLVLSDSVEIESLKETFTGLGQLVAFSSNLDIEKTKKRYLVNGAHAVAAIYAHHFSYRYVDAYYSESSETFLKSAMRGIAPSPDVRRKFLREVLIEFSEAFKEAAKQYPRGDTFLHGEYSMDEENRYIDSIVKRFSETPDSVIRIIGSFRGPPARDSAHLLEFIRTKAFVRILEPFVLYVLRHHQVPTRITEGIDLMVKTIASGNYP